MAPVQEKGGKNAQQLSSRMGDPARSCLRSIQRSAQTRYLPVLARYACTSLSQLALKLSVISEFCTNIHKLTAKMIWLCPNDLQLCAHGSLD
ncbi:hypothetical protein CRG98_045851 [Punica granatum]|uniref:Uncharacterized protein n=1 Tax=Punica granatum TaxID=22663 RepID=A0A2I0HPX3_PUNGR|nr:hypothetical protein CRG98_045851 [Punica granatum]